MSAMYGKAKESLLSQNPSIDFDNTSVPLKIALVGGGYVPNFAVTGHQYFSSLGTNAVRTAALASITLTGGVFDAADVTFTAVSNTHPQITQLVIYADTGTASNSPLICQIDSASTGLPITPNGGDITISFDPGDNRIFRLV
jgi:hypothetical protein